MKWIPRYFLVVILGILSNTVLGQSVKGEDFEKRIVGEWNFVKRSLNNYDGPVPQTLPFKMNYKLDGSWVETRTESDGDYQTVGEWKFFPDSQTMISEIFADYSKGGGQPPTHTGYYQRMKVRILTSDSLIYETMYKDGVLTYYFSKRKPNKD